MWEPHPKPMLSLLLQALRTGGGLAPPGAQAHSVPAPCLSFPALARQSRTPRHHARLTLSLPFPACCLLVALAGNAAAVGTAVKGAVSRICCHVPLSPSLQQSWMCFQRQPHESCTQQEQIGVKSKLRWRVWSDIRAVLS